MWLEDAGANNREVFEVLLATTEAFANAVEHPHEPRTHVVDVEGMITDDAVTISIRDHGSWGSEQARKDEGGLGLVLMGELMDGVQVDPFEDGTTVTMQRRLVR
jgi:anti-sigma regulatory factor (Ser/Thr protein kinase)